MAANADHPLALTGPPGRQRHRDTGAGEEHEDAGRVGAALTVDARVEDPGDQERRAGQDQDQRPDRAGPLRRHAVARAGSAGSGSACRPSPRRRRTRGSRSSRRRTSCRRRCRGTRAPGRPARGRWPGRRPRTAPAGISSVVTNELVTRKTLIITAAVVSSRLVPRIRPAGPRLGVGRVATDVRHHRDPGLEAGHPERELGEDDQRDPDHGQRVAVLLGERRAPVGHEVGVRRRSATGRPRSRRR